MEAALICLECSPCPQNWQLGLSCSSWVSVARGSLIYPFRTLECTTTPQWIYSVPPPTHSQHTHKFCRQLVGFRRLEMPSSWTASYEFRVLAWIGPEITAVPLTGSHFTLEFHGRWPGKAECFKALYLTWITWKSNLPHFAFCPPQVCFNCRLCEEWNDRYKVWSCTYTWWNLMTFVLHTLP